MKFDSWALTEKLLARQRAAGNNNGIDYAMTCGTLERLLQLAMDGHPDEVQQRYEEIMAIEPPKGE